MSYLKRPVSYVARDDVVLSELPDGIALLDLCFGKYFGLNAVGAHVWKMVQTPNEIGVILASVCKKFDVEADVCMRDVDALLTSLVSSRLVKTNYVAESL